MEEQLQDFINSNEEKYLKVLRLLHLIEGVNKSIENSKELGSDLMLRQYKHLKGEYTQELLVVLADYDLLLQPSEAA